jgi:hypothetical protein
MKQRSDDDMNKNTKQRTRTLRNSVQKGTIGAWARQKQHDSKKPAKRVDTKLKREGRISKNVAHVDARPLRTRSGAKPRPAARAAAYRKDRSEQTETVSLGRKKSYASGISRGGQTGKSRSGLVTPSRGKKGLPGLAKG